MRRSARTGCDGGAKSVDVDGDIDLSAFWNAGDSFGRDQFALLAHRKNIIPHLTSIFIPFFGGGTDIADADLGEARNIWLIGCTAHAVAVTVAHTVAFIDEVQMRVDFQDVDVALVIERIDAGDVDQMIATNGDGQGAGCQSCPNASFDIGMTLHSVGVHDIRVSHVYDAYVAPR
ncbi:hypothetical protein OCA8868_00338 [Octadecabacter ascidiaceicola]|uniref:Uncharacterized protein n=1 Tax=Octadecabacter ascidiaceicola TaxID=1655543 RepID=A0A238JND0_9RHOB|nr:hypothetical protein OCA8868_00338 [Octadecabacter ascidiaceicola]